MKKKFKILNKYNTNLDGDRRPRRMGRRRRWRRQRRKQRRKQWRKQWRSRKKQGTNRTVTTYMQKTSKETKRNDEVNNGNDKDENENIPWSRERQRRKQRAERLKRRGLEAESVWKEERRRRNESENEWRANF